MRVPLVIVDPKNPLSIVEHLSRVQRTVDGQIEFGTPQDPNDPASTTLANGSAHNGTLLNILGSWVEVSVGAAQVNTNLTFTHNLDVQVLGATTPNVRWLVFGWQHSGVGSLAGSSVSLVYTDGTVTANSIGLRVWAGGLTVDGGNQLKVSAFFIPSVR